MMDFPPDTLRDLRVSYELDSLIGMQSIKRDIRELVDLVRFYRESGRDVLGRFYLHTGFQIVEGLFGCPLGIGDIPSFGCAGGWCDVSHDASERGEVFPDPLGGLGTWLVVVLPNDDLTTCER
jgi:hypothetical protein